MDVHNPRERIISILNDNDCPSFAVRPREAPTSPSRAQPAISPRSPRLARPNLYRHSHYSKRVSSVSSQSTPPLLRFDSSSSKSSSDSMDSSPSPITPMYSFHDSNLTPFDNLIRQDVSSYMPSSSSITPFMEQQMMLSPSLSEQMMQFPEKPAVPPLPPSSYPLMHAMPAASEIQQMPTPASSSASNVSNPNLNSSVAPTAPSSNSSPNTSGKKNKYPCPYAASHNCHATFTTSGHAARHGKKHTGEKGVHCPICNKAFTRKDNMKQHERTHKSSVSGSVSDESAVRKTKAMVTKEALKAKKQMDSRQAANHARRTSIIHSPLSEVASLPPSVLDTPLTSLAEPMLYDDSNTQMMMPMEHLTTPMTNLYPPIGDDTMLNAAVVAQENADKAMMIPAGHPPFQRGFSDLDTLAQAAESFDPYYG